MSRKRNFFTGEIDDGPGVHDGPGKDDRDDDKDTYPSSPRHCDKDDDKEEKNQRDPTNAYD